MLCSSVSVPATLAVSDTHTVSVISSPSADASRPVAASTRETTRGKAGSRNCSALTLTRIDTVVNSRHLAA